MASTGNGLKEFARLFPGDSAIGRALRRMDALTAHDGRDYIANREATDARQLRSRLLVLVLLEQSRRKKGDVTARGRRLWMGRAAARRKDGSLTRPESRMGLCSKLRCCHKTVQRLWRRLEDAGVGKAFQPQGPGGLAPERLPDYMRGVDFAYLVWAWSLPIPPAAARAAWPETNKPPPPPGDPPRDPGNDGQRFAADLLAAFPIPS